jgi:tetratricopeptide (TPR) repeat protein
MPQSTLYGPWRLTLLAALMATVLIALGSNESAFGQQPKEDPERTRAFKLFSESKFTEAVPLLEKLAAAYPDDPAVFEQYGFALYATTKSVSDPQQRKLMIARAKEALLHSQELGNNSNLLKAGLEGVAVADSESAFSRNKEAESLMNEGEKAYVQGELDKATAAYARAFALDPKLYEAPLFAGDMYFKKKEWDKAGEWFAKAVMVDPDRETAYRYWGDVLMMGQNKKEDSRLKFADAIVAEPYNRRAWVGLTQWANHYSVSLGHPRIEPPTSMSPLKDNKATITIDESVEDRGDGCGAWTVYGSSRASWKAAKFAKEFPNEFSYRHSLREEAEALRSVAELVKQQLKDGKIKQPDPVLEQLVKLHNEGLIEAYVLLARADQGIAKDYPAYRQANRDKLQRYILEYVSANPTEK